LGPGICISSNVLDSDAGVWIHWTESRVFEFLFKNDGVFCILSDYFICILLVKSEKSVCIVRSFCYQMSLVAFSSITLKRGFCALLF